jgi:hypothetical protein
VVVTEVTVAVTVVVTVAVTVVVTDVGTAVVVVSAPNDTREHPVARKTAKKAGPLPIDLRGRLFIR